jgi:hypothetical protein
MVPQETSTEFLLRAVGFGTRNRLRPHHPRGESSAGWTTACDGYDRGRPGRAGRGLRGWQLGAGNCYAVPKWGERSAGLPDFCCWSCSSRPWRRWRWRPALAGRKPCTACASRHRCMPRSRRCHAITRRRHRIPLSPNLQQSDHPRSLHPHRRFKPPTAVTAA